MIKLTLALLAVGATASRLAVDVEYGCYDDWYWEECAQGYFQVDFCRDGCGWWVSPGYDNDWSDDYWVSCDEYQSWPECYNPACFGEWIWEPCSGYYKQTDACREEAGWWYAKDNDEAYLLDDFWVPEETWKTWKDCYWQYECTVPDWNPLGQYMYC